MPIINRDGDGDGVKDINKYQNYIIKIYNIEFRIGNFIIEICKFIVITYLMFIISKFSNK